MSKLCKTLREAMERAGLQNGQTISFHHHLRNGDYVLNMVLEAAAVLAEWRCCRAYSEQVKKPFLFALLINLFSYGAGCMINLSCIFLWRWLRGQTIINWRAFK